MEVTNVFFKELTSGKLLAFANVEFDGVMWVSGFKVFEGTKGTFVVVPQEQKEEKYYDNVRWSDKSFYEKGAETHPVLKAIGEAWAKHKGGSSTTGKSSSSGKSTKSQTKNDLPW